LSSDGHADRTAGVADNWSLTGLWPSVARLLSHRGHPWLTARFTDVAALLSRRDRNSSHVQTKDLLVYCRWKPCSRPTSISLSRVSGYNQADSGKSERLRASLDRREAMPRLSGLSLVGLLIGWCTRSAPVSWPCPCVQCTALETVSIMCPAGPASPTRSPLCIRGQ